LLLQAGIDAKEREAADKLQKLILGELHHRISCHRECNRLPELPCSAQYRDRSEGHGGSADRIGTSPRSADAGQLGKRQSYPHL
jgi:hypothetical protein